MENKEELYKVKAKYRKLRRIILVIILIVIVVFVGNLLITTKRVQSIMQKDTNITLGNNYKITKTITGGSIQTSYYKDNAFRIVLDRDYSRELYSPNQKDIYIVVGKDKTYYKFSNQITHVHIGDSSVLSILVNDPEDVKSFWKVLQLVWSTRLSLGSEVINGTHYTTLSFKAFGHRLWINDKTGYVEIENNNGDITESKYEINVVTDEDMTPPWDRDGYVEKKPN